MDLKVAGLPLAVVCKALDQSAAARLEVLEKMCQCIARPRPDAARYHSHPVSQLVTVPPHLRTQFIGTALYLTMGLESKLMISVHGDSSVPLHPLVIICAGVGGSNLRRIEAETGVSIAHSADATNQFELFAPSEAAMKEAKELADVLLREQVRVLQYSY